MATRRQKQLQRKYASFRKYTANEDVNYLTHSNRSSYRSESVTSRTDARGRSSSTEIVSGSETRSLPVFIAIENFTPEPGDSEGIALEQGQIVEVLDNKNPAQWLVRTKARPPQSGFVPGSYFETPSNYYKQRRRTRELEGTTVNLSEEQAAVLKREQVYHDLLRTEEDFVTELKSTLDYYVPLFDDQAAPPEVREAKERLVLNLREIANFHANVLIPGLNYYSDDPSKVGQTFARLERDFEHHVHFFREWPQTLKTIDENPTIKEYLQSLSDKIEAGARSYAEHGNEVIQRIARYEEFFKEIIKYSVRAKCSTKSMQKGLELIQSIPQRAEEVLLTQNIVGYPGDSSRLGRIFRHDVFQVWEAEEGQQEREVFLFRNKLMITEVDRKTDPPTFKHCATIRLDKYTVRLHTSDEDSIVFKANEQGLPSFRIKANDVANADVVRKAWMKDITEMQDAISSETFDNTDTFITDYDVNTSDARSEFSEYSALSRSRKSSAPIGPEEGPPRKKINSPPAISPTGSSTSLYSGGSSIDWTTTGTTLDMQGTRVTRTQYGFRTLQESSAKMCLKVTGYPLPDISWYKDGVLLKEDERHTFYSDEDGFFALTIDPVQVSDTGSYHFGQASTSAYFKVIKAEREAAPPAFVNSLRDQTCKEGDVVNFECEVEGWPEPELRWMIDDQPLRPSADFRLQYDGQNAKLEIRDAQPEDTGVYAVKIKNEFGEKEVHAQLTVEADPDKNHVAPEFQAVAEDVDCNEGDTVKFKTILTGDPEPEVIWLVNGVPLTASEKVKMINEDGICILTIEDVSRHFDGTVTCKAKNRISTTSCDARLRVRVPPLPPHFPKPLEDRVVTENSAVQFECQVEAWPEATVEFFLKGRKLESGVDGVQIEQRDSYYRITINKCTIDGHDGEIVARAQNEHGQAESRARLTVEVEEEESRSAPTFIKDIEDQTVKHGEEATFETQVKGNPNPVVSWFVNGNRVDENSPGVRIVADGADHKLVIDSSQYAGTVLCRAENTIGRFETKARCIVLPAEKKKKAPEIKQPLSDKTVFENDTAVFEVTVDAEPKAQLTWTLNGVKLTESDKIKFREFDNSYKLEIHGVTLQDASEVTVTASSPEGEASSRANLRVDIRPQAPSFDQKPQNASVERGNKATFTAHAKASPPAEYTWQIDGQKVWNSTAGTSIETDVSSGITRLTIDTSVLPKSGTVVVIAENKNGRDESFALLTVNEPAVDLSKSQSRSEEEKWSESGSQQTRVQESPSRRVLEEKVHESGQESTTFSEAEELQKRSTDERLSENAQSRTEGSIEMSAIETRTTTTERFEEKIVIKQQLTDQKVQKGQDARFKTVIENAERVNWSVNGDLVTPTTAGLRVSSSPGNEHELLVESAQSSATIKCEAERGTERVSTSSQLQVVVPPPRFGEQGELSPATRAKEGEPIRVEVTALDANKFDWTLDGRPLQHGNEGVQIATEDGHSALTIDSARPDHNLAKLSVQAANESGKVESTTQLQVEPKGTPPEITQPPNSRAVHEHEVVQFSATVVGKPKPEIRWEVAGKPVEAGSSEFALSQSGDQYTLRVNDTSVSHTGQVKVIAKNSAGEVSASADFNVTKKPRSPPRFSSSFPSQLQAKEGEPLEVSVKAPESDSFEWTINGKPLQDGVDGVQITTSPDGTSTLRIPSVRPDQAGNLKVVAKNEGGQNETSAPLAVEAEKRGPAASKPQITKQPQDHDYEEESAPRGVKFSAIVSGSPTPTVTWFLNDQPIVSNEDIRVKFDPETGKTSIRIFKPTVAQTDARIKVRVENSEGSEEASAKLTVTRKREIPQFAADLKDLQIAEGESGRFTAKITGFPAPVIEWTIGGQPVTADNIKITSTDDTHVLEITDARLDQANTITCSASNSLGTNSRNATLAVREVGRPPRWLRELEDRMVDENDRLVMEAQLDTKLKPKPTVAFKKDGHELVSTEKVRVEYNEETGVFRLTIPQASQDHKGRISVVASNAFGEAETAASIGIRKKMTQTKPQFLSELAPITITEGDSLKTQVIISGDPAPTAKWFIGNQMVYATEDTEMTSKDGVYTLVIHGCTTDMSGKIKCQAFNRMGQAEIEGKLTVIAPIPVEFETALCDATCREGDTLKLKAVLLGEPMPDVSWYVNGKKLVESQNIKIHAEKGTYTVTIKDITQDYSGKVVCEAVNEFGKASSEATLLVLPRGEPPDFLEWLSNVRARPGSKITHRVVYTGDPRPVLTWYINNKEVRDGEGGITIKTDQSTSVLTINSFDADAHIGEIICKAENSAGEVSCTANHLIYTSDMESESDFLDEEHIDDFGHVSDHENREELTRTPTPVMAPKFITKIKDTRAARGHQAIFECVVPDTKGVVCKWLKDGKEIELIARIRVQQRTIEGHTTNELIIDDVKPEDAGKYTAVVESTGGSDRCDATLTVVETLEKPAAQKAPEFVIKLKDQSANQKDRVVFECKAEGVPQPTVQFFKDNQPVIPQAAKVQVEEGPDSLQRLIIESVETSDQATYSAKATNAAGTTETTAQLTIKTQAPRFTRELTDQQLTVGDEIILECSVEGTQPITVEWYSAHDNFRLQTGTRLSIQHDASNTHWRLVIKNSTTSDFREYLAKATNSAGEATTRATIREKAPEAKKPEILEGLKSAKVKEGETAEMSVKIAPGGPTPTVQFAKDGVPIQPDGDHIKLIKDDDTGKYVLKITNAQPSDVGEYSVKITNPAGEAKDQANLAVIEDLQEPKFIDGLQPVEIKEGESAKLAVTVEGKPEPSVQWLRDGVPVNIDGVHLIAQQDKEGHHSLTVKDAATADAGKFTAKAVNKAGEAESTANFGVLEDVQAPHFTEGLKSLDAKENETIQLECKVVWKKDGVPVNVDNQHVIQKKEADGRHVLVIKDANAADAGRFTAEAVNKAGRDQTEGELKFPKYVAETNAPELAQPFFIEPLEKQEIAEGDRVQLKAKINVESNPEVQWFKDGRPLSPTANMIIERVDDGTLKLTILKATKDDVGHFEVKATNPKGAAKSEADLKFATQHELHEPMFEEGGALLGFARTLDDHTAPEGCTVVFECQLDEHTLSLPGLDIKWTRNDGPIPYANSSTQKLPDGTLKLLLENVTRGDVALYRCTVKHERSSVFTEARLTVTAPVDGEPPEFVELLKSSTTTVGGVAQLSCKVRGTKPMTITWTKQGQEIKADDRITLEHLDDGTLRLTIKNAQFEDTNEYRCHAENERGSAWTEGPIAVVAEGTLPTDGEAPDFEQPLRPVNIKEGEDAVFTGKISGRPEPEIKWFKDEIELSPNNPQYKMESQPDGTVRLTLFNQKIEDAGEIRCAASNRWGEVWSDATLGVKSAEEVSGATGPPLVVRELTDIRVVEGEEANFECAFTGQQPIDIVWYRGMQKISDHDARYRIQINADGTTTLTIKNAEKSDAGVFRAQGTNSLGNARTEANLTVVEKAPTETAPKFLRELEPIDTEAGKGCVFECQASGFPKPTAEWLKDGKKLEPSDNLRMEVLPDGTCRLIIDKCGVDDQGIYSVTLTNPLGSISSQAPLRVKPSQRLRLKKPLEDQTLNRGQKLVLSVEVEGKPKSCKWYKDDQELSASQTTKLEKVTDELWTLEVANSELNDAGNYRVVLSNDVESVESTCRVVVKEEVKAPTIQKGLQDQTLPMGAPLELEIEVDGKLEEVNWLKDDKPVDARAKISDSGDGRRFSLTIPETKAEDFGSYSVEVKNAAGVAKSKGEISEEKPKVEKPEFLQGLQPQTVAPGETAKFEAKTKEPVKQAKWYKNGDELRNPKTEQPDDTTFVLSIPDAEKVDAADYKLVVSNGDGADAESSAALTVKLPPIRILKRLQDLEAPLGSDVVLEIQTDQPAKQIKWFKNGDQLSASAKIQPKELGDNVYQLVLPNVEKDAEGQFKVLVSNADDATDESSCMLTVKLPPAEKPGFAKGLSDTIVPLGKPLELEIKTTGSPKEVTWFKNGSPLSADGRIQLIKVDDNTYKLLIPQSTIEDSGNYEVEIKNDAGDAISKGKVTIEPPIEFLKPLRDLEVVEGERAEFTVETNTAPHTIKWYANGKELKPDNRIELVADGCKISAVLKWSTKEDQGDYKVVLSNSHGDVDSSAKLTVRKAVKEPPKILRGLENQIVAKGAQLVFEVEVEGEVTDVVWKKDGQNAEKATAAKIEKIGDNIYRLTIPAAELSDAGEYEVELSNADGKAKSSAAAEVDEIPSIVKGLIPAELDEGDEHLFRVEVSASVREVKWYRNGNEISPAPNAVFKQVTPKKYELLIPKCSLDDSGDFRVVLSNKAGSCDSSAALTVNKPNVVRVLRPLQDTEVNEGEPLELSCKIEGTPKGVVWLKNGQEITPDEHVKLIADEANGVYKLLIDSAVPSDGAAYRVLFKTDKGDVFSGAVAHVIKKKEEPKAQPATFVSPLQDTTIPEGETLTLKCQVAGDPQPLLRWFRNGEELKPNDRIAIRLGLDGQAILRIRDAQKSDAGDFKVTATNDAGTAESSCVVKVLSGDELPSAPKFVIPLKPTEADVGGKAEFTVKVRGVPAPTVSFTLNGKPLEIDGVRIKLEDVHDGNWTLTINDVQEADFGDLRCKAVNENGSDECSAKFGPSADRGDKERGPIEYAPRWNVPLHDRRVPTGSLLTVEAHVDANPKPTADDIQWFFENKPLPAFAQTDYDPQTGKCRLTIPNFGQEHVGQYKVVASNPLGVADTIGYMDVEVEKEEEKTEDKEFAPRFNPPLEDQSLPAGADLTLTCRVEALPTAHVQWHRDGIPLVQNDRVKWTFDPETGECTLKIRDARGEDQGVYRAVATNPKGSANTSCNVAVKTPKEETKKEGAAPVFTKGLIDQYADKGETLTFSCEATGDPAPEFKIYKNGQILKPSDRVFIEVDGGKVTITIKDATISDEGNYSVAAINPHGETRTAADAHVDMLLSKAEPIKEDDGEAPKFVIPLSDASVLVGSTIEISCKVTGKPMPMLKWTKDGAPLREDARFEWTNDPAAGTYTLRIRNANENDEGTYRASASNPSGTCSSKSSITIDDGRSTAASTDRAPKIAVHLSDVRVNEGQPLKLEARIDASPLPEVVWFKDGARVIPSDRIQLELDESGNARLIIPSATLDDDGTYRLVATNPAGSANDKCNATVKKARAADDGAKLNGVSDAGKAPSVKVPLETIRVPEGESFKLRCQFDGTGPLKISWFANGEKLYSYPHCELSELPDGVCELVVDAAKRLDAGGYRCVAENAFGQARTKGDVSVQQKERPKRNIQDELAGNAPGFTIPFTDKKARLGETVVLECLPYGKPFPSISFLKDGIELTPGENVRIESEPEGIQRLILSNVDVLSEGYYRAVAKNEHGTASTKCEFALIGDRYPKDEKKGPTEPEPTKPRIRPGLYNQSVHQGESVNMQIAAEGFPVPTVRWFKDGQEIISDGEGGQRVIWTDERGFHHLVILNATPEVEGEYSVTATNEHGEAKSVGNVTVILPRSADGGDDRDRGGMPFPPGFIRQLKNKHVFTHLPTIFDCLVVGYPPPEVEWFHNGKRITEGPGVKIQSCRGGSHALLITDTTHDWAGEFVAKATNIHGSATSSAILDVTTPHMDELKFDGTFDITPYLVPEFGFKKMNYKCLPTPPDYGPFIKEVTAHHLTLSWIPTKRSPPRYPQVTYVIEIRELPYKEWTLLEYNVPDPVCKVRNLELGKSYQFRVRAENIYGISDPSPASPPSRLMGPPQPVLDRYGRVIPLLDPYAERELDQLYGTQYHESPWFAPGATEKRSCAENDTISVTFCYGGFPDPNIKWLKSGHEVDSTSPTSNIRVSTRAGTETTLKISCFSRANAGMYQCVATNDHGEAVQKVQIDLANRPIFTQPLNDRTFSSGKLFRLDVRVEGEPEPNIIWQKDWHPLAESARVKFVKDGPYLRSLLINNPMWRDSGVYSAYAVNPAGMATTSCTVTVEEDLDFESTAPKRRRKVELEQRNVRELYEIAEEDEKKAASGAHFRVTEKATGKQFVAQLKPQDETLAMYLSLHNVMESDDLVQLHAAIVPDDQPKLAVLIFENADQSLLDSLLAPVRNATPDPETQATRNREDQVRIFAKQLLTALQYMHHRSIVHLDLRPEAILLQDDHLRLADFGQSRHLLRGKATGEFQGTPEFVSPEIVNGTAVTLASDMWSTGALIFVLLAGVSPFLGDNDNETLQNVVNANYSLDIPELAEVSAEAKDFIQKLLLLDHTKRMSVDQALEHDWLADPALKDAKLLTDCLREFKYQHKWLERRVFVQQTPSEQLTQLLDTPHQTVAASQHSTPAAAQQAQPYAVYDYNKIKNARPDRPQQIPEIVANNGKKAAEALSRSTLPKHIQEQILQQLQQPAPPPPFYDPRSMSPGQSNGHPAATPNGRAEDFAAGDPRRFPGGQPPRHHLRSPGAQLPPASPNQLQPQQRSPGAQRRRLEPQAKGETPSQTGRLSPRRPTEKNEQQEDVPIPPIELVRGTHRDIQLELATRNLSDISEECSIAGSQASLDDFQDEFRVSRKEGRRAKSRSVTPHADSESTTPLASPSLTVDSVDPIQQFFGEQEVPAIPELSDPSVPVGAPLFLEGLGFKPTIVSTSAPLLPAQTLSPGTPGSKSPVIHSPKSEHSMTAVIATKYGKQGRVPGMGDEAAPIEADGAGGEHGTSRAKMFTHRDTEFDLLMDDVDRLKAQRQKEKDDLADLEKYRPSNFYKEEEPPKKEMDLDEFPWESNYQIGPETLLLATKGAAFNARVRDYRRELWGDGAPLVRHGILGFRNQEITVRERRRFTDLLREDKDIAKSVEKVDRDLNTAHAGTTRRIRSDLVHTAAPSITKNSDGTHAPVFRRRLKDVHFREGAPAAVFECEIVGEPAPEISFFHRGSEIVEDNHHKLEHKGEVHRLTIVNPYYTDVGEYSVTARNAHGMDESAARLLTGDPPAQPSRPEVELASDTEAFITWEAPQVATSLEGLTYKLESRPAGEDDHFAPWTVVSENVESEAVVLKHLNPYGVYQFRVTAKNAFGWGSPSLTSRIIRTHKRGAPKLNLDLLQQEHRFVVLQLPQAMAGRQTGLMEISEEFEEDELAGEAEGAADDTGSVASSSGQDPSILNTGDPNERFQMNREIFRGKFSVVRDAVETKRGVACAVKIRPFDKNEFDLLALCQNENVVKLLAGYKSQNCLLLFTERLHENVFDRFTSVDQYNEEQICLTLRQLASALRWIHFRGVVHMDVQPNNVMFATRRSWFLKLIDFERAVSLEGEPPKKPEPKSLNPEWAAPEMLRPDGQMSEQVDLWGLGMVAFCLLGGFHPFSSDEDTVDEVRENVLKQKCDPNMIPVQASQDALRFVTWALKKDPSRRMRGDEALAHRFLSSDPSMVRRREHIRYPSTRLQRTAARTMKRRSTQLWDPNVIRFTEDRANGRSHGFPNGHPNGAAANGRTMEI